jgi:hypothetical protein
VYQGRKGFEYLVTGKQENKEGKKELSPCGRKIKKRNKRIANECKGHKN